MAKKIITYMYCLYLLSTLYNVEKIASIFLQPLQTWVIIKWGPSKRLKCVLVIVVAYINVGVGEAIWIEVWMYTATLVFWLL